MRCAGSTSASPATPPSTRGRRPRSSIRGGPTCTKVGDLSALADIRRISASLDLCIINDKTVGISLIGREDAAKLPNKTVIFPHDPERRYIVELDVFHQLHCLVRPGPESSS